MRPKRAADSGTSAADHSKAARLNALPSPPRKRKPTSSPGSTATFSPSMNTSHEESGSKAPSLKSSKRSSDDEQALYPSKRHEATNSSDDTDHADVSTTADPQATQAHVHATADTPATQSYVHATADTPAARSHVHATDQGSPVTPQNQNPASLALDSSSVAKRKSLFARMTPKPSKEAIPSSHDEDKTRGTKGSLSKLREFHAKASSISVRPGTHSRVLPRKSSSHTRLQWMEDFSRRGDRKRELLRHNRCMISDA